MIFYLAWDVEILAKRLHDINEWTKVAKFSDFKNTKTYKRVWDKKEGKMNEKFEARIDQIVERVGKVKQQPFKYSVTSQFKEIASHFNFEQSNEKIFSEQILKFITLPSFAERWMIEQAQKEGHVPTIPRTEEQIRFLRDCIMGGRSDATLPPCIVDLEKHIDDSMNMLASIDFCGLYGSIQLSSLAAGDGTKVDISNMTLDECLEKFVYWDILNQEKTYFFTVALEYSKETKEKFWDFPPATRRLFVSGEQKLVGDFFEAPIYANSPLLFQILRTGAKVKFFEEVWEFPSMPLLRRGAFLCNKFRQLAKNEAESSMFKLIVNSTYGKLLYNPDKGQKTHIQDANTVDKWSKFTQVEFIRNEQMGDKTLVAVKLQKNINQITKPMQASVDILFIAKALMLSLVINLKDELEKKGVEIRVGYSDTDSIYFMTCGEKMC